MKVLATDLDGSLFYPKHRKSMISEKALEIIRRFHDGGGKVVLVTGRNFTYCKKVISKIGRPVDVVGCNGSYIFTDGKVVETFPIQKIIAQEIVDFAMNVTKAKIIFAMSSDGEFVQRKIFKNPFYNIGFFVWNLFEGVYREPRIISEKRFDEIITSDKALKIMAMYGIGEKNKKRAEEATEIFKEKFANKAEIAWSNECIELSKHEISKSNQLKYLLNYLKITTSDVYVVGDSGNDISMFREFHEHSFCLSHSPLSVSKYANKIIERFEDIEKYLFDTERK